MDDFPRFDVSFWRRFVARFPGKPHAQQLGTAW